MMRRWEEVSKKNEEEITIEKKEVKAGSYKSRRYNVHQNCLLPKRK